MHQQTCACINKLDFWMFCQAFLKAWKEACEWTGRSRVWIPMGTYRVNSAKFEGPCKGPIAFVIKGYLKAPTEPSLFITQNWINFRYVNNLTVSGGGVLDGQGKEAWAYNDCNKNPNCPSLPTVSLDLQGFPWFQNMLVYHVDWEFWVKFTNGYS